MTYKLTFLDRAEKDWKKLAPEIRDQFRKKLHERKSHPRLGKDKLHDMKDCYKIKLRTVGYRLVYKVYDDRIVIQVIAVGKRDKEGVYNIAALRVAAEG